MNRSLALADQIYRFLLCSYPKGFRRKYGAEMASVFADTCRDTHQRSGMTGVVALWFATAGDWIVSVCAEQAAECATALKWDCRVLSDRPGFAAAAGAVLSILIFVLRVMLTGGLAESLRERFLLFAITSVLLLLQSTSRCYGQQAFSFCILHNAACELGLSAVQYFWNGSVHFDTRRALLFSYSSAQRRQS